MLLFVSSFVFNLALSGVVFALFGGRQLLERRVAVEAAPAGSPLGGPPPVAGGSGPPPVAGGSGPPAGAAATGTLELDRDKALTLTGILALIAIALACASTSASSRSASPPSCR